MKNSAQRNFLLDTALTYAKLGLSVIPTNSNKQPIVKKWKQFQERIPTEPEIKQMFRGGAHGIAIICGKVSSCLIVFDFDLKYDKTGKLFQSFCFAALANGFPGGLLEKMPLIKTKNNGRHLYFRCQGAGGNEVLAARPATPEESKKGEVKKPLIETRGEGGYAIAPPTPAYDFISGTSFENIPVLSEEQTEILYATARSFNEMPPAVLEPPKIKTETTNFTGLSPFDDFNKRGDVVSLLVKHGWSVVFKTGSKTFLKRPGGTDSKQSGNYDSEKNWFIVFSTSTIFEVQKAYLPYAVYAVLECGGDFSKTAKQLYDEGYGDRKKNSAIGHDKFFSESFADNSIAADFDFEKIITSSADLLKMDGTEQRYLLYPLIPKCGTGILAGQPDTGKSRLSGHLALCIALGLPDFLEFQLHTSHKRVLIVCTEDDAVNTSYLLQQQLKGLGVKEVTNLHYIFSDTLSQHEVLLAVDEFLSKHPCDLVLFDAFADLFIGQDSNSNQAMRLNVRNFNYFAQKHSSFFLFVHHTTKASFKQAPNQNHILGAGGLAQKCRFAWMLSQGEGNLKFLTVVKGNFCPREYKMNSIELNFHEKKFIFSRTGREIPIDLLNTEENKSTQLDKLQQLAEEIFLKESVTYKEFCFRHNKITGKAIASAARDHKLMKELEIIFKNGKNWALNS